MLCGGAWTQREAKSRPPRKDSWRVKTKVV
jgi:hypothetical protein